MTQVSCNSGTRTSSRQRARFPENNTIHREREERDTVYSAYRVCRAHLCLLCRATACDADVLTLIRTSVTDKR